MRLDMSATERDVFTKSTEEDDDRKRTLTIEDVVKSAK